MLRYRWPAGMWAFVLHRVTGVFFTGYLLTHIYVISHLAGGEPEFNRTMRFLSQPAFKMGEIALLALILFHMLNGARIVLFDWADAFRFQKALFYSLVAVAFVAFIFGAIPLLPREWFGGFLR